MPTTRRRLAVVALVLLAAPFARAQLPTDSVVRAIIRERVDAKHTSGLAVGLLDADGRTRTLAHGIGAGGRPLDEHSVFEIGSITKTFTATILADMMAEGLVRLDQPVAELLPSGWTVPSRNARQITLVDLSTHSSGLPRMPNNFKPRDPANPYADYDSTRLRDFLAGYQLSRDVGASYEYSNLAVGLLGFALARRAGTTYERLVTDRVLRPLGMNETAITLTPAMRANLAPGHGANLEAVANWDLDVLAGAGALRSTVHDMLRYIRANVDPPKNRVGAALTATQVMRFNPGQGPMTMGLGWHRIVGPGGDTSFFHNGGTAGYRTFVGFNRAKRVGVVVLANGGRDPDDIGRHLLDPKFPLWTPPVARTEVAVDSAALDRLTGDYPLSPAFVIAVRRDGDHLTVQATNQPAFRIFAESPTKFFLKAVDAQLEFEVDSTGKGTAVTLVQNGARQRAVRKTP
jgi:serine-type D-Ala-D-Ala carboxypeptidase/endopeptidase